MPPWKSGICPWTDLLLAELWLIKHPEFEANCLRCNMCETSILIKHDLWHNQNATLFYLSLFLYNIEEQIFFLALSKNPPDSWLLCSFFGKRKSHFKSQSKFQSKIRISNPSWVKSLNSIYHWNLSSPPVEDYVNSKSTVRKGLYFSATAKATTQFIQIYSVGTVGP